MSKKPISAKTADRHRRLAEALKRNLKRRKAAAAAVNGQNNVEGPDKPPAG